MATISIIFLLYFICCVYFYAEVTNYLNCTNREVMFLFCNVILIIIGKESGLSCSSPQHHNGSTHVESFNQEVYELPSASREIKVEEERIDSFDCDGVAGNAADSIGCLPIVVFEEESKEMEVEAVEEEDEEEVEILTKRIEEFIERNKKMRRQEALQLMVA